MTSYSKAELIAVCEKDSSQLTEFTQKISTDGKLQEILTECSRRQLDDIWDGILRIGTSVILDSDEDKDVDELECVVECILDLATTTVLVLRSTSDSGDSLPDVPHSLQEVVIILHGLMPTLQTNSPKLCDKMSCLFEDWWLANMPCKQEVMSNTLLYLLAHSSRAKAYQKDVTRLWKVHKMLTSVDLAATGSASVVELLLQCLHHHQFVSTSSGIQFLTFIFTLTPKLTDKLHNSVKVELLATPKSWLSKYGEIYFRAWQQANPDLKQHIEEKCLQDLMYRAIHAKRLGGQSSPARILFKILSHLHRKKTQRGVEAMLTKLYAPILWRSLKVANADVRINAASIMFDAFPLQSSSMNVQETDELLQRQFDLMHELLMDVCPDLRVVAVKGVGRVLNLYWELIPIEVIQSLVTCLTQDLAYDCTTPAVREAVIQAMTELCDNHLCVLMLKKVLPEFKNFIHDTSEKVRIAMLDLLLKVKGLRAIKFWSVVPVEHILSRLETDSRPVVRKIMKLIHTSFAPMFKEPAEQMDRLLSLIKGNPGAARQFFLHLPQHLALEDTVKIMTLLCRYAIETVRHHKETQEEDSTPSKCASSSTQDVTRPSSESKKAKKSQNSSRSSQDDSSESIDGEKAEDDRQEPSLTEVLTGVINGLYLMFTVAWEQLKENKDRSIHEGIAKKLCITVREVMSFSQDSSLDTALIALCGRLPNHALPLVSQNLVKRLRQIAQKEKCTKVDATILLKTLICWGKAEPVLEMIRESLVSALKTDECSRSSLQIDSINSSAESNQSKNQSLDTSGESAMAKKSGKKKKKTVGFAVEELVICPRLALTWLVDMFTQVECQSQLINKHKDSLVSVLQAMQPILCHLRQFISEARDKDTTQEVKGCSLGKDLMVQILIGYLRLLTFLNFKCKQEDISEEYKSTDAALRSVLNWTTSILLPCLSDTEVGLSAFRVSEKIVEVVLQMCHSLLLAGTPSNQLLDQMVELCMCLSTGSVYLSPLVYNSLRCLYQITQLRHSQGADESQSESCPDYTKLSTIVNQSLCRILESATRHFVTERDEEMTRDDRARMFNLEFPAFRDTFLELTRPGKPLEEVEILIAAILNSVLTELKQESKTDELEDDASLPPLSSLLIAAVKKRATNQSLLTNVLDKRLTTETSPDLHQIHAFVFLVAKLRNYKHCEIPRSTERSLGQFLSEVSQGEMDEDAFRHLKKRIETVINSWETAEN